MSLPDGPTERQLIDVDVASIAMGSLPRTYIELDSLVWKIFNLGRRAKELEITERESKED